MPLLANPSEDVFLSFVLIFILEPPYVTPFLQNGEGPGVMSEQHLKRGEGIDIPVLVFMQSLLCGSSTVGPPHPSDT
jgi:hypothetical protein